MEVVEVDVVVDEVGDLDMVEVEVVEVMEVDVDVLRWRVVVKGCGEGYGHVHA